jgi:hypothetical protein
MVHSVRFHAARRGARVRLLELNPFHYLQQATDNRNISTIHVALLFYYCCKQGMYHALLRRSQIMHGFYFLFCPNLFTSLLTVSLLLFIDLVL